MAAPSALASAAQDAQRRVAEARVAFATACERVARLHTRLARAKDKLARRAVRLARAEAALAGATAPAAAEQTALGTADAPEAYCVKCKVKRPLRTGQQVVLKNGRRARQSPCPVCGTTLTHLLRGLDT